MYGLSRAAISRHSSETHFSALRTEYRSLKDKIEKLEEEVNDLSYRHIPAAFEEQEVRTIKIDDVGRVTVNRRAGSLR